MCGFNIKLEEKQNNMTWRPVLSARRRILYLSLAIAFFALALSLPAGTLDPNLQDFPDPTGAVRTVSTTGSVDTTNPFFQSLGTNGRACISCHQPGDAWTVTPRHIQQRFEASHGEDPIFRPVDGANCPSADVSTEEAREHAYSMLLRKGLIRIALAVPANAEFDVIRVQDPHNCPETTPQKLAMFRRPLPSTNLGFLSTVMWDGRENAAGQSIHMDLMTQAKDATLGHAEAANSPTDLQLAQMVSFELALFTAQSRDHHAGALNRDGGQGGPAALSQQTFHIGINDVLGKDPSGAPFDPNAFTIFQNWADPDRIPHEEAREAVARGEKLFNTFPIPIKGVAGLNDALNQTVIMGTCTSCHDTPNAGDHSVSLPINIGITDFPALAPLDTRGLPVYTLVCKATGKEFHVTDPGRAMISGKCADIGKTKGPILRGLAARAPYFHNGSAASLEDVVNFYDVRFHLHLSERQKDDMVAFLRSL
jgi:cytochrome c peroxidase